MNAPASAAPRFRLPYGRSMVTSSDWILKFQHAGIWYPIDVPFAKFADAWDALTALSKLDRDAPVERCIVKSFD